MKILNIHLPKSFLDLTKGHLISQIIGAISSVLIAKIYGPSILGVFSVFFTMSMIFSTLNTARLECVLFLDQNNRAQQNNSIGLLGVVLGFSFLYVVLGLFMPEDVIIDYFVSKSLFYFIVLGACLNSMKMIFQNLTLLKDDYRKIKYSKIIFTVIRYVSQFLLFYILTDHWGLVVGYLIALIFVIIYFSKGLFFSFKGFDFVMFLQTVKNYKGLIKYAFPGDLVNTISVNIFPVLIIGAYGEKLTGNYFMSFLILSIPLSFLHSSVAPVFFKKTVVFVNENNWGKLYSYVFLILKRVFLFLSLPLLMFTFIGEELIVFFFDEEWRNTGVFLEIFSLLFAFRVLYSPISSLEESLSKNHISLLINIYFIFILLGGVYFGRVYFSIFQIAKFISIMTCLGYFALLIYFLLILKSKAKAF